MNTIQKQITLRLVLILLALSMAALSCNFDDNAAEVAERSDFHYYAIDPEALTHSIELGESPQLSLLADRPSDIPFTEQKAVNWQQENYFQILKAIYKDIFKDSIDGWSLNSMSFSLVCSQAGLGLQDGSFRLFKIIKRSDGEARLVREVDIDARNKFVFTLAEERYPRLENWESIDTDKLKVSAEDAVQIAEKNGGEQKRLGVKNNCGISLLFAPSSIAIYGWQIKYDQKYGIPIWDIGIDPFTGEIKYKG